MLSETVTLGADQQQQINVSSTQTKDLISALNVTTPAKVVQGSNILSLDDDFTPGLNNIRVWPIENSVDKPLYRTAGPRPRFTSPVPRDVFEFKKGEANEDPQLNKVLCAKDGKLCGLSFLGAHPHSSGISVQDFRDQQNAPGTRISILLQLNGTKILNQHMNINNVRAMLCYELPANTPVGPVLGIVHDQDPRDLDHHTIVPLQPYDQDNHADYDRLLNPHCIILMAKAEVPDTLSHNDRDLHKLISLLWGEQDAWEVHHYEALNLLGMWQIELACMEGPQNLSSHVHSFLSTVVDAVLENGSPEAFDAIYTCWKKICARPH